MKLERSEKLFVETLISDSYPNFRDLKRLTGDASTRRYYRFYSQEKSYVVCLDDPLSHRDSVERFVNIHALLEKNKVRVPQLISKNLEKGFLLEEDLGDKTMLENLALLKRSEQIASYQLALKELVKIHQIESGGIKLAFDCEKFQEELKFSIKFFLEDLLGVKEDKVLAKIEEGFLFLSRQIGALPRVFTHRDYHSRNLMWHQGRPVVIDFQDARMGPRQYDLCSLLEDCYFCLEKEAKGELIDFYLHEAGLRNHLNLGEFRSHYDLVAIQRVFKALGSFAYIYKTRGDARYLRYIGIGMENLRSIYHQTSQENTQILHSSMEALLLLYYRS